MLVCVFVTTPHYVFDVFDMFCAEVFREHLAANPSHGQRANTTAGSERERERVRVSEFLEVFIQSGPRITHI